MMPPCVAQTGLVELTLDISSLVKLRVLSLSSNRQLEDIPESISCLQNLQWLSLRHNSIHQLPMGITALSHMTRLWVMGHRDFRLPPNLQVNTVSTSLLGNWYL
jgi:Leucine-rich repeat (LRR) protein